MIEVMADTAEVNETRQQLLMSALHLFAEHGIEAVSLRAINQAAGSRNASAVHYHFGDKVGIVRAVTQLVKDTYDIYREPALNSLEARFEIGHRPTARETMWACFGAYPKVTSEVEHGRSAILFSARQNLEADAKLLEVLRPFGEDTRRRAVRLLAPALPHLPTEVVDFRYTLTHVFILQSIAGLARYPGAVASNSPGQPAAVELIFDYAVAGLEGHLAS